MGRGEPAPTEMEAAAQRGGGALWSVSASRFNTNAIKRDIERFLEMYCHTFELLKKRLKPFLTRASKTSKQNLNYFTRLNICVISFELNRN